MGAQQEAVAQGTAVLVGDDQRVLRVARRMAGREVHALEVVEVGLDFGADADGVAEGGKDAGDLVERAGDGVLGAGEALRAGQGDVDGLGGEGGVSWTGAGGLLKQAFDQLFEGLEALAYGLLGLGRGGLEPAAGDLVEQALLAAQPVQAKGFDGIGAGDCGCVVARPAARRRRRPGQGQASSNAVRLGISSFIMRNDQDKPLHVAGARLSTSRASGNRNFRRDAGAILS